MTALLQGLRALGPARLAALGLVAFGVLGLLALLVAKGAGQDQMALLYGDLDPREAGRITDQLSRRHIRYKLAGGGTQILVPTDQIPETRLFLARDGLPSGGSIGYELFDRGDGLAFTEFQQKINETRALEGEIARTIRAIAGVRQARVHLVLPRREPFARDRQDAQASVLLTMVGQRRLDNEGVQAILNLVAAAVPGLRARNISIVDSRGDLLARAGQPVTQMAQAQSGEEVRRSTELRLARAVEEMLERSLGPGRVRAEATVRMNFDRVNETQERYDPEGQVTRSTQTVNQTSKSTESASTVTVQNNLPNADAGAQGAGSQEARQEETTNFEISKTVRTLIREQPQLDRVSIAVMIDGATTPGADGKPAWAPRPQEELTRITALVKSAIGYDERRGDVVEVVSMRFVGPAESTDDGGGLFGLGIEKAELLTLAQSALFGLIGLLALLLVLRPMVRHLTTLAAAGEGGSVPGLPGITLPPGAVSIGPGGIALGPGGVPLPASAQPSLAAATHGLIEDESMVNMAMIEGQLRASSLRRLSDLVEKHPTETLTILRGWMATDNA
jgi:flagellar M-ring protein FliF